MDNYEEFIGKKVNILVRPSMMKDWIINRETERCLVLRKEGDTQDRYHLSKKIIIDIFKQDEKNKTKKEKK